ncbi:hypothetical protein BpHYR1_005544 [Brachionus plicatilis]|uniref:Uncharacterized protein n=1 Tax=Brachionus plicatilis TaxID=10195 RepID=A0A3M7SGZ4_BRAPC|nr:hypothetical protein BpHYR1_005544 [Brachionus plicatilis]
MNNRENNSFLDTFSVSLNILWTEKNIIRSGILQNRKFRQKLENFGVVKFISFSIHSNSFEWKKEKKHLAKITKIAKQKTGLFDELKKLSTIFLIMYPNHFGEDLRNRIRILFFNVCSVHALLSFNTNPL